MSKSWIILKSLLSCTRTGNLASLAYESKDYNLAITLSSKALKIEESIYGMHHPSIAINLNCLGLAHSELGNLEAINLLELAIEIDLDFVGRNHPNVAQDLNNLAIVYGRLGNPAKAVELLNEALEIYKKYFNDDHFRVKEVIESLEIEKKKLIPE